MTDLHKQYQEAQAELFRLQQEIYKQSSQGLIDAVEKAKEEAAILNKEGGVHDDAKKKVKELVREVFGSGYGVRRPAERAFNWPEFVKQLKNAGVTSKSKSETKSGIEELVEKMPKDSQWNKQKDEYLNSDGKGTKKTYWAK